VTPALAADLIDGINRSGKHHISMSDLEEIICRDDKQRYAFNEDMTKIRANQGHSIPVDVELEKRMPPENTNNIMLTIFFIIDLQADTCRPLPGICCYPCNVISDNLKRHADHSLVL